VAQLVKCLTLDFGSGHWALRWAWSLLKILSPSDLPQLSTFYFISFFLGGQGEYVAWPPLQLLQAV